MSKVFYDEYINLGDVYYHLKAVVRDDGEKEDLWSLVDEFVHLKMMEIILDNLKSEFHEEFLRMYIEKPYDDSITSFLNDNMAIKFPILIENEMEYLQNELALHFGIEQTEAVSKQKRQKKTKKSSSK